MSKENKTDACDLRYFGGIYPTGLMFEDQLIPKDMRHALRGLAHSKTIFDVGVILKPGFNLINASEKEKYLAIKEELDVEDESVKNGKQNKACYVKGATTFSGMFKCLSNRIVRSVVILPGQEGQAREDAYTIRRNIDYREETALNALCSLMPLQDRSASILPVQPKKPQTAQIPSATGLVIS